MATTDQSVGQSISQWVTIQEASEIIGKSENAIGLLVRRRRFERLKKVNGAGKGKWLIHRDSLVKYQSISQSPEELTESDQSVSQTISDLLKSMIPLEHYEKKRDEWVTERDRLQTGLMMYRYKFEEIEKQMRLLPAPVEVVNHKLDELEEKAAALTLAESIIQQAQVTQRQYEEAMEQLKFKLQEEEHAKEAFRIQWELSQAELKKPWWQKLWKR